MHPGQELVNLLRLLGFMALVILPENLIVLGIDDDSLYRGEPTSTPT